ncbi:hypothetical protein MMC30_000031 [Trapelia coarctata]|nr:hypothetical protein [Trapelia coarctata]
MLKPTAALLQAIKKTFKPPNMYSKSPEKFEEAMTAVNEYCAENKGVFQKRKVAEVVVLGAKHNDPEAPDPRGKHWTLLLLDAEGEVVTKKHVYPGNKMEGAADTDMKGEAKELVEGKAAGKEDTKADGMVLWKAEGGPENKR